MTRAYLIFLLAFAAGAADKDDPLGWTTAKWGMSEAQVRSAVPSAQTLTTPVGTRTFYKTNAVVDDKWTASIGVPSLDLAGSQWQVFFLFEPDKGLARVILQPINESSASAQEFQEVEALVTAKYGRSLDQQTGDSEFPAIRNSQWAFPSTTISLRHVNYRAKLPMESLSLTYEHRSTGAPI